MLRIILSILLVCTLTAIGNSQEVRPFEGEISLIKKNLKDTIYAVLTVKGDNIRYDELDEKKKIKNYTVINIGEHKIYAFNVHRKLYTLLPIRPWIDKEKNSYEVTKTGNYKEINGYKCYQWKVKNNEEDIEVTYWVDTTHFNFFYRLMKLLNIQENIEQFFLVIPGAENAFPMLAVERTILREWKSQVEIVGIKEKKIDDAVFDVPQNYTLFEK